MIKKAGVKKSMILNSQTGKEPMVSNNPGSSLGWGIFPIFPGFNDSVM
ncbi:MAG: hypothetical protein HY579_00885 [Nitrospinae bacterium]|nr:hypothetical protein [Nitrospinota bacterium]